MPTSTPFSRLRRNALLGILAWSLLLGASLIWNWRIQDERSAELATSVLRAAFAKDQAFRFWAARYGGVYVKTESGVTPNPYLAHLGDRDLTATDGTRLTLLNPAAMLTQVMAEYAELYGIKGRIVGQIALNPKDLPDTWENQAIEAFKQGAEEVVETMLIDGEPHLRLMKPMIMQPSCMKCHGHLGYQIGEVRGGVGVSMPLNTYIQGNAHARNLLAGSHLLFWLLGVLIIWRLWRQAERRERAQSRLNAEQKLASHVIDDSSQAILITDANGRIQRVNRAFCEITGYSAEDAIGKTPRLLRSEHHAPDFYKTFWSSLRQTGRWQGEFWNRRKNGEGFPVWQNVFALRDTDGTTTNYVSMFQDVTAEKAASEQIQQLAHYDILTGLPNRVLFEDRLKHALARCQRNRTSLVLLYIDLDDFKKVNDSLGHAAGDTLLQIVSQRMQAILRQEDTLARLGGDEFAVIAERFDGDDPPLRIAGKLIDSLIQSIHLGHAEVFVGASIGCALFPHDGNDGPTLLRNADTAMYRAKQAGRNRCHLYSPDMSEQATRRLTLETALRHAIDRQELILHYQARVTLGQGGAEAKGCEALIRWQHTEQGLVSPLDFIPIAEENGMIVEIGNWVLNEACRQARTWRDEHGFTGTISVNVSPRQLFEGHFVERVCEALHKYDLPAEALELEITETGVMQNIEQAQAILNQLSKQGIRLALDDFGTGYSSLSLLKRLPFDCLKIDRSFVRDLPGDSDDCAVVTAIIAMAQGLQMRTVAEGVETPEQVAFLSGKHCHEYQGYHFSRPLPASDFALRYASPDKLSQSAPASPPR